MSTRTSTRLRTTIAATLLSAALFVVVVGDARAQSPSDAPVLSLATDKAVYSQGDVARIMVANTSATAVSVVDRSHLHGDFATIERQAEDGRWRAIELYAAANVSVMRVLKPGERHVYLWPTVGYNRADTVAQPGTYRIRLGPPGYSNVFLITTQRE